MITHRRTLLVSCSLLLAVSVSRLHAHDPLAGGVDQKALDQLVERCRKAQSDGLIVVKDGVTRASTARPFAAAAENRAWARAQPCLANADFSKAAGASAATHRRAPPGARLASTGRVRRGRSRTFHRCIPKEVPS
jgi:hypothetical protein